VATINLLRKIKIENQWKFVPVEFYTNGRIKHDSRPGTFYLDWRENGKRKRKAVGTDPATALHEYQKHTHRVALGMPHPDKKSDGPTLHDAIDSFLADKKEHRKKKTHQDYKTTLDYFRQSCFKVRLADVSRQDVKDFILFCQNKGMEPRTVFNKYARVVAFLRSHKINLMEPGDAPQFVEEEPEAFEREDLDKFFAVCSPDEWLYFQFFLCTGMREQEVMYAFLSDLRLESGVVRVSAKPEYGFKPKAYKGREIPLPEKLVTALRDHKAKRKDDCPLLFPTAGCKPKFDFLDLCKKIAKRAGLNPDTFWLHKFRATFATWALQGGVDLRTVQAWMGHSDLASTMRYLQPARGESVKKKVDTIFA
jgi:integrase/recombinase XerD